MSRILTFNCHEAYVHLLGRLALDMDIVDGLPGRVASRWDERMRPVPPCARLIGLDQGLADARYDVAIAHNLSDLMLLRDLDVPKILVLHVNLRARMLEERGAPPMPAMQAQLQAYLSAISAVAVAVSASKAESWGQACPVIRPCADPEEYCDFKGEEAVALRVANQIMQRPMRFAWETHCRIVQGHAIDVVGHNPELDGSRPAASWSELKAYYRSHRVYVHTAGVGLDDGYNLGLVEAMMTGMPVVSSSGSDSPVVDGESGYVSDDVAYLNGRLGALLADRPRAYELGCVARDSALELFNVNRFVSDWYAALDLARKTWRRGRALGPS